MSADSAPIYPVNTTMETKLPDMAPARDAAPVQEIEIRPEMIEAGSLELGYYSPREDSPEPAVSAIFRAMMLAKIKGDRS